ncbi:hypothetical protein [Phormidium tenue]|uniref:Uncharacterized protein n=1 Tax=Phormidium tenue FACHB-1050 TaxID=2692857 RepID=A0ABR8CF08_9CYAN|nr:hypothetical protein [Phormidium tenue]MBD2318530.1 hypothetical protein [Phormidium tenue FACHB-1050]
MLPFIPLYDHLFSRCFVSVGRSLVDFGEVAIVIFLLQTKSLMHIQLIDYGNK